MKKVALAATLIFSTVAAFNNTGIYLTSLLTTDSTPNIAASTTNAPKDFIPMTMSRADLAQADGEQ